jgi:DNA-binding NarL/FixJ family response regulator
MYILVVDDDICLAYAIQSYLSSKEKKIFIVDNVVAAIKLLRLYSFDLVISDVLMPSYNGYDLLYYLRLSQDFGSIPFILLTAKGMTLDRIQGYDLGCSAYLAKPFYPSELLSVVDNLLNSFVIHNFSSKKQKISQKIYALDFTDREISILHFLVKGMTNKEIAASLNLTLRNVEKYVSRLLAKTQTRNRTELAQLFLANFDSMKGE